MLDVCLEWLTVRAETTQDKEAYRRFQAFQQSLNSPPSVVLTDRGATRPAVLALIEQVWERSLARWKAQASPVAEPQEWVPPGWTNEDLLAQMKASMGMS